MTITAIHMPQSQADSGESWQHEGHLLVELCFNKLSGTYKHEKVDIFKQNQYIVTVEWLCGK